LRCTRVDDAATGVDDVAFENVAEA